MHCSWRINDTVVLKKFHRQKFDRQFFKFWLLGNILSLRKWAKKFLSFFYPRWPMAKKKIHYLLGPFLIFWTQKPVFTKKGHRYVTVPFCNVPLCSTYCFVMLHHYVTYQWWWPLWRTVLWCTIMWPHPSFRMWKCEHHSGILSIPCM